MTDIRIEELTALCFAVLKKYDFRDEDAKIIVTHLIENECAGKASHGMVRLPEIIRAIKKHGLSQQDPTVIHDQENICVLESHGQIGVVAGQSAVDEAIKRAKEHGLAMVGVRNYIATTGSMAHYLKQLSTRGLVAIMGCNSVALVAPPAGRKRMIGTNPIGIAIPGNNEDKLIADLATSAIAYGKILVMNDKGEDVPDGVLINEEGKPSIDPKDAYNGAILPLADHKGFALGLMVELLAGPLLGAKAIKEKDYDSDGLFIIALDPLQFGNGHFYEQISKTFETLKTSPTRPGHEKVSLAGERSEKTLQTTKQKGIVNVAAKTLRDINFLIEKNENATD